MNHCDIVSNSLISESYETTLMILVHIHQCSWTSKQHFKILNDILSPKTNILEVLKWNINDVNSHSPMSMNSKKKLMILVHTHQCSWNPIQHIKFEDDLLNPKTNLLELLKWNINDDNSHSSMSMSSQTTFQVWKLLLKLKICLLLKGSKCSIPSFKLESPRLKLQAQTYNFQTPNLQPPKQCLYVQVKDVNMKIEFSERWDTQVRR